MEHFDRAYRDTASYFGSDPDSLLVRFADLLPAGAPVLDVGAGQGRHALWLARRGLRVVALDPSREAVATVGAAARAESLPVDPVHGGFADLQAPPESFGAVLLLGLLQLLSWPEVAVLRGAVDRWTAPQGLLLATSFTTADPSFARIRGTWTPAGRNSYVGPDGERRTFLEPGEILDVLPAWELLHHNEGLGPWHRHGDGPRERHARVEVALRRRDPGASGRG